MSDTHKYRTYNSNIQAPNMKCKVLRADDVIGDGFDILDMEERLTIAEFDINTTEGNVSTLDTRLTVAEGDIDLADNSISILQGQMTTANTNISTLQGQMTTANTNVSTLQSQMTTANTNISTLQGQMTTANTNISTLQGQMTTANTDISTLQSQMTTANTNISTLQGQMATANTNIGTLQGEMTTANTNISTLQGQMTTANTNITDLQNYNTANRLMYYRTTASQTITAGTDQVVYFSYKEIGWDNLSSYDLSMDASGIITYSGTYKRTFTLSFKVRLMAPVPNTQLNYIYLSYGGRSLWRTQQLGFSNGASPSSTYNQDFGGAFTLALNNGDTFAIYAGCAIMTTGQTPTPTITVQGSGSGNSSYLMIHAH